MGIAAIEAQNSPKASAISLITTDKLRVARFVASIPPFDKTRGWGEFAAIGYELDGELIGGTIYHNWSPEAGIIELSSAATDPRWLNRRSIFAMFDFPFTQLGCQLVALRVSQKNDRMRSIAKRFGFSEYLIPRLRGRDEAECVYTFTVEQWRAGGLDRRVEPRAPLRLIVNDKTVTVDEGARLRA